MILYNFINQIQYIFYNDLLSINLRSFLNVVSNYYYHSYFLYVILFSALVHLFFVYLSTIKIIHYFKNDLVIFLFSFFRNNNIISIVPDVILILVNSTNNIRFGFLLINIITALIVILKPFNKMTHVVFHMLLLVFI